MASGDPVLDNILAQLDAASVALGAAVKAAAPNDAGIAAALPASIAATQALEAYQVPSSVPLPPPPPQPPTTPLTLARIAPGLAIQECTHNADGTVTVRCMSSPDVMNARYNNQFSGKPVNGVLTFAATNIAVGTTINVIGWGAAPKYPGTNVLTFKIT